MPEQDATPTVDVVVLSQGDRQAETRRALESARVQTGVQTTLILLGNGWQPEGFDADVQTMYVRENVGPPEGRNIAAARGSGEFILFLDNDAWLRDADALERAVARFRAEPGLGLIHARVSDPSGVTERRWVPRARVGDPAVGGPAFAVCEGVVLIRRAAYQDAGGFPGSFFFGNEGVELAWRMRDRGWELVYDPSLHIYHPATSPDRHDVFFRLNARNRVWVARRNLPWPVAVVYVCAWTVLMILRTWRRPADLRLWLNGLREGLTTDPGGRRPMRWRTVLRLARLGQPPII
ncbi:glycosyltransferase [Marihabitans asiaticum]|uniref:GT2 family glycosyltransferase n=1 Tax=Marihabitans asiaticum TaxID=415218 RepID=A0A560WGZ4_9MICO|nr:glycosyltransferase [Marihabitans asiaticum]TWD16961.1 GT2 family glycosyltransferase [Marihabitans asiaticum]